MFEVNGDFSRKAMLFAGCSFTWGQGLYYYSNLPTLLEPAPDAYDPKLVTECHRRFMMTVRFPRLVANHFGTFELVQPGNGGSNHGGIETWNNKLQVDINQHRHHYPVDYYEYSEIGTVVFQFTQPFRDFYSFKISRFGKEIEIRYPLAHILWQGKNFYGTEDEKRFTGKPLYDLFLEHIEKNNLNLEAVLDEFVRNNTQFIKQWLENFESKGIKTIVTTWPDQCVPFIEEDEFLRLRFVPLEYKGKIYKSMETLMGPDNPELTIKTDHDNFKETPKDHHPSLLCHKVMADNIIKFLSK